ncbi:MAG: Wzz/FepE/Etk N-terminal domain-containing protein [Giesbergeria sp.]
MTQDPNTPEPEHLPAAHRGPAPSHALQLRGNHALGMPTPQAPSLQEEDDDTLDLRDLWRMVVKHKGLLVSVALVGLLAAVLLSFIKTPLYLATTTVQVDKRAARVVQVCARGRCQPGCRRAHRAGHAAGAAQKPGAGRAGD